MGKQAQMRGFGRHIHHKTLRVSLIVLSLITDFNRVSSYGSTGQNINIHQNLGYSSYGNGDLHTGMGHEVNHGNIQHLAVQSIPISEHIEVTKPVVVPVVKNIGKNL